MSVSPGFQIFPLVVSAATGVFFDKAFSLITVYPISLNPLQPNGTGVTEIQEDSRL